MNIKKYISVLCAAALIAGASSCKQDSPAETRPASPAAAGNTTTSAAPSETTSVNGVEVVVGSSGAETTSVSVIEVPETNSEGKEISSPAYEPVDVEYKPEDGIYISVQNANITPETEKIDFTVELYGDKTIEIAEDFTLERLNKGVYSPVKLAAGFCGTECVSLSEGNPYSFSLTKEMLSEPLKMGYYRIAKVIDGNTYYAEFFVSGEMPELTKDDIQMYIEGDTESFLKGTKGFNLEYVYTGNADYAEYCFGCYYTLEKKENGEWRRVEFGENSAFIDLGYLIGTESPFQSTYVSLSDDFYAEPITAGEYRVVKDIENLILYAEFKVIDGSEYSVPAGYEFVGGDGAMTLTINEIKEDMFVCSLPWPYPAVYSVSCKTADFSDYCVGDNIEVDYSAMYKSGDWDYLLYPTQIYPSSFQLDANASYKPVIYLYPEEKTEVSVQLDYNGKLTVTYPEYGEGWNVTALPDGTLYDKDNNEYFYLFWEGKNNYSLEIDEGFCVKGEDTAKFLREKLELLGLNSREINDFIIFWLPFMQDNEYNLIKFQTEEYTDNAKLLVTPAPDTQIRVFMTFTPSKSFVEIPEQKLTEAPERTGFTLVEWGGSVIYK
ncbi:MAG: immunoglobulin-like domain-containing protein [Ruminiclostridium sp.]